MGTAKTTSAPSVDVLELLATQHAEVDAIFEKLEQDRGDRTALFVELADKLAAHATIEEKIFYPAAMGEQTTDMLHEAVEEHLEVKRLLADIITRKIGNDDFKAKIAVLKENVSHHAHEEEEGKLFPILRKMMSVDELGALGNECLALFEELLPTHPYKNVPAETAEAAPLPQID